MPFSVKILRFFGILLLSLCALGVAGMTKYMISKTVFIETVNGTLPPL